MTAMVVETKINSMPFRSLAAYLSFRQFSIFNFERRNRNIFRNIVDAASANIEKEHLPEKGPLTNPIRTDLEMIDSIKSSSQFWTSGQWY